MKQNIEESSAFKVNGFIILGAMAAIGLASGWFIAIAKGLTPNFRHLDTKINLKQML